MVYIYCVLSLSCLGSVIVPFMTFDHGYPLFPLQLYKSVFPEYSKDYNFFQPDIFLQNCWHQRRRRRLCRRFPSPVRARTAARCGREVWHLGRHTHYPAVRLHTAGEDGLLHDCRLKNDRVFFLSAFWIHFSIVKVDLFLGQREIYTKSFFCFYW